MGSVRTPWHLSFSGLVSERAPSDFDVQKEVQLTLKPQRADIILLRRRRRSTPRRRPRVLRRLWKWLGKATKIFKKMTLAQRLEVLEGLDLPQDIAKTVAATIRAAQRKPTRPRKPKT